MSQGSYAHSILLFTAGLMSMIAGPVSGELYINEIAWDCGGNSEDGNVNHLAGSDTRDEYIELRGSPGMSLANHYLIFVEAEDNDTHTGGAGQIENFFDLGSRVDGQQWLPDNSSEGQPVRHVL